MFAILQLKNRFYTFSVYEDFSLKINNEYFFGAKYIKQNIRIVIQNFFARVHEFSKSQRFNMFLYPSQLEYLEKAGRQTGMNKSEYVRKLINRDRRVSYKSEVDR